MLGVDHRQDGVESELLLVGSQCVEQGEKDVSQEALPHAQERTKQAQATRAKAKRQGG